MLTAIAACLLTLFVLWGVFLPLALEARGEFDELDAIDDAQRTRDALARADGWRTA